jgi:hypothetical protein
MHRVHTACHWKESNLLRFGKQMIRKQRRFWRSISQQGGEKARSRNKHYFGAIFASILLPIIKSVSAGRKVLITEIRRHFMSLALFESRT